MKISRLKKIMFAMAGAILVAITTLGVPSANADIGLPATTYIYWTGSPCIVVVSANLNSPTTTASDVICGGKWSFTEGNIWPGDYFGADPIMGAASYIECAVFRGGMRVWFDAAVAGDGTDVSCLRVAI